MRANMGHWELDPSGKHDCIFVAEEYLPMRIIPPALFSDEMLEQIRVVVCEEIRKVAPRQLQWEEIDRLEAYLKQKKCRACGKIPLEAILSASAFAGADLPIKYPLCECDMQQPVNISLDNLDVIGGAVVENQSISNFGEKFFAQVNTELTRYTRPQEKSDE